MKLIFIRHGDPDYEHDTITEKGIEEAKQLASYIDRLNIDDAYQSPLGRAVDTAAYSLEALGLKAKTLDWLREFPAQFDPNISKETALAYATALKTDPDTKLYKTRIMWDVLPSYYGVHPELFDRYAWRDSDLVKCSDMVEKYDYVRDSFYELLKEYGYERDGDVFKVIKNNDKRVAFFCHFGITAVILSTLWNVSPFVPLQFLATAPTSVTELATEERQKGIATFRTLRIGDTTHISIAGAKPSFSARFCERFENEDERH